MGGYTGAASLAVGIVMIVVGVVAGVVMIISGANLFKELLVCRLRIILLSLYELVVEVNVIPLLRFRAVVFVAVVVGGRVIALLRVGQSYAERCSLLL